MKKEGKNRIFRKLNGEKIKILKKTIYSIEEQPNFNGEIDLVLHLKSGKQIIILEEVSE